MTVGRPRNAVPVHRRTSSRAKTAAADINHARAMAHSFFRDHLPSRRYDVVRVEDQRLARDRRIESRGGRQVVVVAARLVEDDKCQDDKNALGRTSGNCAGELFVTRYATSKKVHSTKQSSAGNLAGKTLARLHNIPDLLRKFLEFESSPGHQILLLY